MSFFILLPNLIKVISLQMAPYSENEVIITTVSYESEVDGDENLITGNLFQPSPKFGEKKYPAIIACHPFFNGLGKELMNRWCVELAKRDFVVLAVDLPGYGMSIGEMDFCPHEDFEPYILKDGIKYLKELDFVKGTRIGLLGHSYGGAAVSMTTGILGDYIEATISLNGFTNLTNVLIERIFPDFDIDFTVKSTYIEIEEVDGKKVTSSNIKEFLKIYGIIRGNEKILDDLIISGTNRFDRNFLKKFDAVEHLSNAKDDSVMFIHSEHDKTFAETNQSGQGYKAIRNAGKRAYYLLLDDNHAFTDDSEYTVDYCIINFFEEKLKDIDLGVDWSNDLEKYSQERDIELIYAPAYRHGLLRECIIYFELSLIPFFIIIKIIFYNKKIATERAKREEKVLLKKNKDNNFIDLSFGRGSYYKTAIFLILTYIVAFTTIIGISLGFFSELIAGTLCAIFYLVFFLTIYYLPDQAEVNLWARVKKNNKKRELSTIKTQENRVNKKTVILMILVLIIISSFIGALVTFLPKFFYQPLEQIIIPMLVMGSIFLVGNIYLIIFFENKEKNKFFSKMINWEKYTLDKYQILKNLVFGSVIFLNILFQWNIWAFYMKLPTMIAPHSIYYLYAALGIALFFAGIHLIVKILKKNILKSSSKSNKCLWNNIMIELLTILFGLIIIMIVSFITFTFLLNTSLFGNLVIPLVLVLSVAYVIASVIDMVYGEKGVFGIRMFVPLTLFTFLAFFFHI
ncbi:MAG: alpha/beta hydrolase family protein [Promethearchaeota archaeon]